MARDATIQVAYAPWTTFNSALDKFHEKGLPDRLDRTVFAGQSGSTQAVLMAAMRSVGGIDDEGRVQPLLQRLVDPSQRQAALKEVLQTRYKTALDLSPTATQAQFDQVFRDYGLNGTTHRKATAFFLSAADDVGIKVSKYIARATKTSTGNGAPKPAGNKKSRTRSRRRDHGGEPAPPPPPPPADPEALFHPAVDSFLREARKLTDGAGWTKEARDRVVAGFTTQLDLFLPVKSAARGRSLRESAPDNGAAES